MWGKIWMKTQWEHSALLNIPSLRAVSCLARPSVTPCITPRAVLPFALPLRPPPLALPAWCLNVVSKSLQLCRLTMEIIWTRPLYSVPDGDNRARRLSDRPQKPAAYGMPQLLAQNKELPDATQSDSHTPPSIPPPLPRQHPLRYPQPPRSRLVRPWRLRGERRRRPRHHVHAA